MAQEPLYRRIPEQGKHPANSKKIPGAISGAALDDKTNRPSGSSDFMPVEGLTEEEYLRRQRDAAYWAEFTTRIMDWTWDKTMDLLEEIAIPALMYRFIPAAKRKIIEARDNLYIFIREKLSSRHEKKKQTEINPAGNKGGFISKIESSPEYQEVQYEDSPGFETVSREQYDQLVSMTKLHALLLASDIRRLSSMCVMDIVDEEKKFERQQELERLTSSEVMNSIQLLLSEGNRSLLDDATRKILSEFKSGFFLVNEEKVPIGIFQSRETQKMMENPMK